MWLYSDVCARLIVASLIAVSALPADAAPVPEVGAAPPPPAQAGVAPLAEGAAPAAAGHQHPLSAGAIPAGAGDGSGQPIMLEYACGNRFVVGNAYQAKITVTYAVAGTGETGSVRLDAAPAEEPGISEAVLDTRSAGTVVISWKGNEGARGRQRPGRLPAAGGGRPARRGSGGGG